MSARLIRFDDHSLMDVVGKVTSVLRASGVAIAPTDTVYGLLGRAFDDVVFARMDEIKGERRQPYAIICDSIQNLEAWYGISDPFRRRAIRSLLPGPATVVLRAAVDLPSEFRYLSNIAALRVPSDELYPALARNLGRPLWATSANRSGALTPIVFSEVDRSLISEAAITVYGNEPLYRAPSSVVNLTRFPFRIDREGSGLSDAKKVVANSLNPLTVVVLCTGNICRSPLMAAALSQLLGVPEICGVKVISRGTNALNGAPATSFMADIAAEHEIDLASHRSHKASVADLREADFVLVMEREHNDYVRMIDPDALDRTFYAGDPEQEIPIVDPYGSHEAAYRETANLIFGAAEKWASHLREIVTSSGWAPLSTFDNASSEPQ